MPKVHPVTAFKSAMSRRLVAGLLLALLAVPPLIRTPQAAGNTGGNEVVCTGAVPAPGVLRGAGAALNQQPDLVVDKLCTVNKAGVYNYGRINIVKNGSLVFVEPAGDGTKVDFWASSIIIENGGSLIAGGAAKPYGERGGVLNIYIYGKNDSVDGSGK